VELVKRREFLGVLGGTAAWPLAARAQQPAMRVIGMLSAGSPQSDAFRLAAFRQGLNETGCMEGRNVTIEYRGMQGHYDLLSAIIDDFVRRPVAVIVASLTTVGALAAKAATATIPIVFIIGADPIEAGLVASLNQPGGNITGLFTLGSPLAAKRLELLHELVPRVSLIAFLVNPSNAPYTGNEIAQVQNAARSLRLQLHILNASTTGEIDAAFATLAQVRAGALLISGEAFLGSRHEQIVALAAQYGVPTIYSQSEYTTAGGLISYGFNLADTYRQIGIYTGRILKGDKPADLPVQQSTKVELIINLKTAMALGINFPLTLRVRADKVIE
jgi:putative tryptophan/tyrosine transport system substrate-binding protein